MCSSLNWFEIINKNESLTDWESLAVEFVAVELNIMSGVCPNQISDYLERARDLLAYCTWSTDQSDEANNIQTYLSNYNNNERINSLVSGNEQDASTNNNSMNSSSLALLLSILIPGIILTIVAITATVIYIKKRQQQQNQVPL